MKLEGKTPRALVLENAGKCIGLRHRQIAPLPVEEQMCCRSKSRNLGHDDIRSLPTPAELRYSKKSIGM
jgi:hypothetical protein